MKSGSGWVGWVGLSVDLGDNRSVKLDAWPGLEVLGPVMGGSRSTVLRGRLHGRPVAVVRSRRGIASLDWELELLVRLEDAAFVVPTPIPTRTGALRDGRWSVRRWIEGRPPESEADWLLVAAELQRLHHTLQGHPQRPDACAITQLTDQRVSVDANLDATPAEVVARCVPHFEPYSDAALTTIHGDPGSANLRIVQDGRVGLLDWDESRRDVPDLDLADLGVVVLSGRRRLFARNAADAWETLNGWLAEPDYARSRLQKLPRPEPTVESPGSPEPHP